MVLKRLKVRGFKSFADKTELSFGEGVTAIVGPNGCGKSNILDSIRWVLGEQNPRHLRGLQMQDVVFAGSEGRRAESLAEVSLVLDNQDRVFPLDYSEILVTRRLYRSGESQYLINKEACRLRDITELFMDTGIGKSTYSIMEQGRVEQILNSKPTERRAIFEEAAGITKYKARREEAMRKLARTEQDLVRITDILSELGRQVRSLKRQAGLADRYEKYLNQLHELELALIARRAEQIEEETKNADQEKKKLEDEKHTLAANRATLQAALAQTEETLSQLDEQLHRLSEKQIGLRGEMQRQEEKVRSGEERIHELKERTARLQQEVTDARRRIESSRENLEQKTTAAQKQRTEVEEAEKEAEELRHKIEQLNSLLASQQETVNQHRSKVLNFQNELSAASNDEKRLQREQELISVQGQKLTAQQRQLSEEASQVGKNLQEKNADKNQLTEQMKQLESSCVQLAEELKRLNTDLEQRVKRLQEVQGEIQSRRSRLNSLLELQKNFEGYYDGVKYLMQEKGQQESELAPRCFGPLADLMNVEKGYETAIETALAFALQYLVVQEEQEAVRLLKSLRSSQAGRAGFVPLSSLRQGGDFEIELDGNESDIRLARDVVQFPQEFESVAQLLFRDVLIAPSLDRAIEVHKKHDGVCVITLDGERLDATGVIAGGSHNEAGILSRKREIGELETALEKLEAEDSDLQKQRDELRSRMDTLGQDLQRQQGEKHQLQIRQAELQQQIGSLASQRERLEKQQASLAQEQTQRAEELSQLADDLQRVKERLDHYKQQFHAASEQFEQEEALLKEKQEDCRKLDQQRQTQAVSLAEKRKDMERSEAEIESLKEQTQQLERLVAARNEEQEQIDKSLETTREQIETAKTRSGEIVEELEELEQTIKGVRSEREGVARRRTEEHQSLELGEKERETLDEKIVELESKRVRLNLEKEELTRRLRNDFEKAYTDWPTFDKLEDRAQEEIEEEATTLHNRIQRLGPVNRLARSEYEEANERFEFLTKQKDDLEKARGNLLRTISEVKRTAKQKFQEVFEEIQENFRRTFRTMFGGGKADLVLLDEQDIVESGIEIVVQPPGKNLQSISLLSGGEKALTAVSLLFAIYLIKPSPFCILDEIDAPLDDANIGRFTKVLHQFTDKSQFLIITHNKRTMEMADRIYGVTMPKSGISEIVSMNFEKTEKAALEETAEEEVAEEVEDMEIVETEHPQGEPDDSAMQKGVPIEAAEDEQPSESALSEEETDPAMEQQSEEQLEAYEINGNIAKFKEQDFAPHKKKQQELAEVQSED